SFLLQRPQLILLDVVGPSRWYADITLDTVALDATQRLAVLTSLFHQDKELENIRGLVGLGNACYAVSALPVHKEVESLPLFRREGLKLLKLLGSGAFGEVYEGVAARGQSGDATPDQRVAVKTLRKHAAEQEKIEFLKEAHLMSQFNHSNILRLLGVCVLNEPHYIILELMEGGDLRSYLIGARPSNNRGQLLDLTGLLDISLDVAKGCAYLEKLHFIHRDLAARNCLVSVRGYADPERVVKIGDFGLARDVYKSDYYRKRGEGLLPVRWMPPESLTDGIFNKHSDVWAFGVLLWEIMTLGKQPYPAFSNQEVLHHVNVGGRLPAPAECPQSLYVPYKRERSRGGRDRACVLMPCALILPNVSLRIKQRKSIQYSGVECGCFSRAKCPLSWFNVCYIKLVP
uniref:Tyrosine-protein kinase receptor n=1 Tax=Astyanax mexicanus TaxID=7994 RepID=W5LNZ2_ASTMX